MNRHSGQTAVSGLAGVLALNCDPAAGQTGRFITASQAWAFSVTRDAAASERSIALARDVFALATFDIELSSEGLEFWIGESWGIREIDTLEGAAKRLRAAITCQLLDDVRQLFPRGVPTTEEEMQRMLEEFEGHDMNPIVVLDLKFRNDIQREIAPQIGAALKRELEASTG